MTTYEHTNVEMFSMNYSPDRRSQTNPSERMKMEPYIRILEQPASHAKRFRYKRESRSAGSWPGVNSSPDCKTYPKVQLVGFKGRALIVVSCVTKNPPYRAHPHNLVGKGCEGGVCSMEITRDPMIAEFANLGIQCVKKTEVLGSLIQREQKNVDPFREGFSHKFHPENIDLKVVRLCFQAYLQITGTDDYIQVQPVVSDPMIHKEAMICLDIHRLSDASASVRGGKEMILLCEKISRDDIEIRFYEEKNGIVIWEAFGEFQPTDVHKQSAIYFRTPKYKDLEVQEAVKVFIQLRRPSDQLVGNSVPFLLKPEYIQKRKLHSDIISRLESMPSGIAKRRTPSMLDSSRTTTGMPVIYSHLTDIPGPSGTSLDIVNVDRRGMQDPSSTRMNMPTVQMNLAEIPGPSGSGFSSNIPNFDQRGMRSSDPTLLSQLWKSRQSCSCNPTTTFSDQNPVYEEYYLNKDIPSVDLLNPSSTSSMWSSCQSSPSSITMEYQHPTYRGNHPSEITNQEYPANNYTSNSASITLCESNSSQIGNLENHENLLNEVDLKDLINIEELSSDLSSKCSIEETSSDGLN